LYDVAGATIGGGNDDDDDDEVVVAGVFLLLAPLELVTVVVVVVALVPTPTNVTAVDLSLLPEGDAEWSLSSD
jgi:hypothetical protein